MKESALRKLEKRRIYGWGRGGLDENEDEFDLTAESAGTHAVVIKQFQVNIDVVARSRIKNRSHRPVYVYFVSCAK